jgi:hypothetical protein
MAPTLLKCGETVTWEDPSGFPPAVGPRSKYAALSGKNAISPAQIFLKDSEFRVILGLARYERVRDSFDASAYSGSDTRTLLSGPVTVSSSGLRSTSAQLTAPDKHGDQRIAMRAQS